VIPQELRHKQEPTAVQCRLIGYQDGITKGWKLLRESDWMIFTRNDVTFDENTSPTALPDCDKNDTNQLNENDGYELDDLEMLLDENDRELFTEEPENDTSIEEISDNNLDERFYDVNSDVCIDELLASHVQFTATNDLDPDSVFCYQTATAFDAPFAYKQAISGA
jgi:hypothetical protein